MNPKTDIGGQIYIGGKAKPQTAGDATAVAGAIIDRLAANHRNPQSCLVICNTAFTSSSGASGGKNTLSLQLYHDTASNMATEAELDSDSYIYTWVADGANDGVHVLPVNLKGANRYIRAKATLTKAGTITIASQQVSLAVVLAGMDKEPSDGHAAAGFEVTTEPT